MVTQNRHNILTNLKAKLNIDSEEKDKHLFYQDPDSIDFNMDSNGSTKIESDDDSDRKSENGEESECDNY